ncbi:hypothetical protein L3Y34_003308 [Caenorhabditis briggsae]|uniref:Uncharacterized protein n=1 Tax=Caenorhabditis briggsae TaxID=6238 RepID=A0AAE9AA23_CAEBR|nr:hypothetical protein L3Y34_003308 [Caenorhabditis briggsae]
MIFLRNLYFAHLKFSYMSKFQKKSYNSNTFSTLWIVCYVVREYASKFLPYSFPIQIIGFIFAIIGTWRLFHFYRQGDWMRESENLSIVLSIFTQTIGILLLLGNRFFNIPQSDFCAFSCLMGVVFHLRFSYFFENPLKIECLLTIVRTRAFVKHWYPWMVVFNGLLWSGLSLLILLPPNSPYTVPRPPCLVHNFIGPLVGFCILAPIIFFGTILKMYCDLGPINYDYLFFV